MSKKLENIMERLIEFTDLDVDTAEEFLDEFEEELDGLDELEEMVDIESNIKPSVASKSQARKDTRTLITDMLSRITSYNVCYTKLLRSDSHK